MARMVELTYTSNSGRVNPKKEMTARNVLIFQNTTIINVHEAKTAKPGIIQIIKLQSMNSPLGPVKAIERRRQATEADTDSLFGYNGPKGRVNLTTRQVNHTTRTLEETDLS
ncbi:hypothetical protein H4Q26_003272 [Puccinia striiformis f. sp. tritici PST-130]|uniref:Uncharacterized protein n=1 Tax=Puccinia striiformis f. sp. tritici PST-78 TaxID=1165861 RepID=A0A0L0UW23_9BASI|nr:hypothetical protein H4Q26_003272 [Puccinia striiformis f. sp. tritici PST-130]KNE91220.1 hypothetical protein PSTG_15348 [Puccinia striiformis f. sp. tritici PST-78]